MKRFHSTGTQMMTTARLGGVCLMSAIAGLLHAYFRLVLLRFKQGLLGQFGRLDLSSFGYLADRRDGGHGRYRRSEQCSYLPVLRLG
ncbi:MAG TPA: hypothetical protein V6D06_00820 [Trichocoleus sp.]